MKSACNVQYGINLRASFHKVSACPRCFHYFDLDTFSFSCLGYLIGDRQPAVEACADDQFLTLPRDVFIRTQGSVSVPRPQVLTVFLLPFLDRLSVHYHIVMIELVINSDFAKGVVSQFY